MVALLSFFHPGQLSQLLFSSAADLLKVITEKRMCIRVRKVNFFNIDTPPERHAGWIDGYWEFDFWESGVCILTGESLHVFCLGDDASERRLARNSMSTCNSLLLIFTDSKSAERGIRNHIPRSAICFFGFANYREGLRNVKELGLLCILTQNQIGMPIPCCNCSALGRFPLLLRSQR